MTDHRQRVVRIGGVIKMSLGAGRDFFSVLCYVFNRLPVVVLRFHYIIVLVTVEAADGVDHAYSFGLKALP